jgi:very-short-patch-repair endonuclease
MTIPYESSFASHPRASCWHPTKNGDVKPHTVFRNSNKKRWFGCDNCPHSFQCRVSHINEGMWCPYCSKSPKKICEDEECRHCFEKSFASHPKALCWHPTENGDLKPHTVFKNSHKKCWFCCDKCHHNFEAVLGDINKGRWCPYCSKRKLCEDEECRRCFENSFASHPKALYWHPTKNGDVKPRDVTISSRKRCWFDCDNCSHSFEADLCDINKGRWCPMCKNKTEQKLYEILIGYYLDTKRQFTAKWCKNFKTGRRYPFDFCIKSKKVIIELDGRQHFEDVKHWNSSFEDRHSIDLVKQLDANDNGYRVIRIIQDDVWTDRYDWLTELLKNIQDDTHQNVFMCKDDEYDFFIESINHLKSASAV